MEVAHPATGLHDGGVSLIVHSLFFLRLFFAPFTVRDAYS